MSKTKRNIIIIVASVVAAIGIVLAIVLPLTLGNKDKAYTVTFESNGGSEVGSITDVKHNSLITEPQAPVRTGYVFAGWFNKELTRQWVFDTDRVKSDMTLYAKWDYLATEGLKVVVNGSECTVMGIGSVSDATNVVIPSSYDGMPVTAIGANAFASLKSVETVFVPSSVRFVGSNAFLNCTNLVSVTFEGQKAEFQNGVFSGCTGLQSVALPSGLEAIPANTFYNCASLESLEVPVTLTSIGEYAFYECVKLASFDFPSSLGTLGRSAFSGCVSLKAVSLPASLNSLGEKVFAHCIALETLTVDVQNPNYTSRSGNGECNCIITRGVLNETPEHIALPAGTVVVGCKTSNIPSNSNIVGIGPSAFCGMDTLVSVYIPVGVTRIYREAFFNCSRLTLVEIPSSVTEIEEFAFNSCSLLREVRFLPVNPADNESDWTYKITTLGKQAFAYCGSLTGFVLPSSLESVGVGLFCGNDNLSTVSCGLSHDELNAAIRASEGGSIGDEAKHDYTEILPITCTDGQWFINYLA